MKMTNIWWHMLILVPLALSAHMMSMPYLPEAAQCHSTNPVIVSAVRQHTVPLQTVFVLHRIY